MRQHLFTLVSVITLSATAHSATVISRDNTRHEGVIVEDNAEGVKVKVVKGTIEALVSIPRADILEIQNTPVKANPIDAEAKELLMDAEFAMQTKNLKEAGAAWAKLGALYQSSPGYRQKAGAAFENALTFDPENALALAKMQSTKPAVMSVNDARFSDSLAPVRPVQPSVATAAPILPAKVPAYAPPAFDGDRARDRAVFEMLSTGLNTTPIVNATPGFDNYPERSSSSYPYSSTNSYSEDYRPRRTGSNCSPNRWSIFPYAVHAPGMTVTSSTPTYVIGNCQQQCTPQYTPPYAPQHHCNNSPPQNSTPNYSRPPQTSTPGMSPPSTTSTITTPITPGTPSNTTTQSNQPPPPTTTTTFRPQHGNNGLGNGVDPQPPGNPKPNDLTPKRTGRSGSQLRR